MAASPNVRFLPTLLASAALTLAPLLLHVKPAQAQQPNPAAPVPAPEQTQELNELRPLNQASSNLSIASGQQLMQEATAAIANQNYVQAAEKLQAARQAFNQMSNYYQELSNMFLGVDSRLNQSNRGKALETAQLRDQATFQLALVYRAQNRPDQAVPLLMEILRSQQPTRDLGQRAYQQLFELGFVDEPFSRGSASSAQ
jgi:tetratricopeptide (TPR) repeat protein